jgi:hypothetical protein
MTSFWWISKLAEERCVEEVQPNEEGIDFVSRRGYPAQKRLINKMKKMKGFYFKSFFFFFFSFLFVLILTRKDTTLEEERRGKKEKKKKKKKPSHSENEKLIFPCLFMITTSC